MPRTRPRLAVLMFLALCLTAMACTRGADVPSPSPTDFAGIVEQLAKRGILVANVVAGDAGCPDATLAPTAIAFDASGLDQREPIRIRVYIFRNHDAWQRLSGSVASCAHAYVTDSSTYESLAPSPFVVSGQGPWPPGFAAALKDGFTVAAGSGD
ncbi:MAG TPA: hypothetical protein VLR93_06870 [Patescibacteria group bacterium]|nr:hypothetical protein [Patescibacteria group bacterium]